MTIFIIGVSLLMCLLEGIHLLKKGMYKEFMAVIFILSLAIFLQISKNLGIMTPIGLIEKFLEPIGKSLFKQF